RMNKHHIGMELDVYAQRANDALLAEGYTADETSRAAQGLLSGTRLWPTLDGAHIDVAWMWVECLRSAQDGMSNLSRGRIDSARANLAEAREWSSDAIRAMRDQKTMGGFMEANDTRKRRSQSQAERWQSQAMALWQKPQHAGKGKYDIARLI